MYDQARMAFVKLLQTLPRTCATLPREAQLERKILCRQRGFKWMGLIHVAKYFGFLKGEDKVRAKSSVVLLGKR